MLFCAQHVLFPQKSSSKCIQITATYSARSVPRRCSHTGVIRLIALRIHLRKAAAKLKTRQEFDKHRSLTDQTDIQKKIRDATQTAKYLKSHIIQAKRNSSGNYGTSSFAHIVLNHVSIGCQTTSPH